MTTDGHRCFDLAQKIQALEAEKTRLEQAIP
jgi:hypothetical protein